MVTCFNHVDDPSTSGLVRCRRKGAFQPKLLFMLPEPYDGEPMIVKIEAQFCEQCKNAFKVEDFLSDAMQDMLIEASEAAGKPLPAWERTVLVFDEV